MKNLRKNHHYVSQSYLRAWASHHKIWTFRTLVSHSEVPEWSQSSIRSIANHQHLFTRTIAGDESDEIEIWMDQEIETPAQTALSKARSNESLNRQEWECLLKFVALHDIRSPANYIERMKRWTLEMPGVIEEAMQSAVNKMESDRRQGYIPTYELDVDTKMIPMRLTKEVNPESEKGQFKTEVILGRGLWLFSIRHVLTNTYKVLNKHTWNILSAPEGMQWITSDNPVVRLNYYGGGSYDFKGGWDNEGGEIIFPLSPELLLYTQAGNEVRMNAVSRELATTINRFIAENAHRHIFSSKPDSEISGIRPRTVDQVAYEEEKKEWETWHIRQMELEKEYQ